MSWAFTSPCALDSRFSSRCSKTDGRVCKYIPKPPGPRKEGQHVFRGLAEQAHVELRPQRLNLSISEPWVVKQRVQQANQLKQ